MVRCCELSPQILEWHLCSNAWALPENVCYLRKWDNCSKIFSLACRVVESSDELNSSLSHQRCSKKKSDTLPPNQKIFFLFLIRLQFFVLYFFRLLHWPALKLLKTGKRSLANLTGQYFIEQDRFSFQKWGFPHYGITNSWLYIIIGSNNIHFMAQRLHAGVQPAVCKGLLCDLLHNAKTRSLSSSDS